MNTENLLTMKQWRHEEAERLKVAPITIACRIKRKQYRMKVIRKNARVVFVVEAKPI